MPADESEARRSSLGCRVAPPARPRRSRLVLRRQRDLRHGDRAAHLPDPGRRPDHRSGPAATTCSATIDSLVLAADLHRRLRADQGQHRLRAARISNTASPSPSTSIMSTSAERRVLDVRPSHATHRFDDALGVQEAFVDYHLRNVSDRFDFDSHPGRHPAVPVRFPRLPVPGPAARHPPVRQSRQQPLPVQSRGDLAAGEGHQFRPQQHPPDAAPTTGSLHANLFRQDFPFVGLTSQASLTYNMNRERGEIEVDDNGFPVRPALFGNLRAPQLRRRLSRLQRRRPDRPGQPRRLAPTALFG